MCAKTAAAIWEKRNGENEAWIDSIPALRERKKEAGRNNWRYAAQKTEKAPRKRTRLQQKKADRDDHKEAEQERVKETMAAWEKSENERREAGQKLRVGPEEVERVTKKLKAAIVKGVVADTSSSGP